jgi:hypothetical protein
VHHEFLPPGIGVIGHFFVQVLQRLRDAVPRKRSDKWQAGTVVCASRQRTEPHIACCARIPSRGKHSCHRPTIVLSESRSERLLAVLVLKMGLEGTCFATMDDIKSTVTVELRRFQKNSSAGASNNGRFDGASVCVCVCVCVCTHARILLWS